MSVDTVHAPSRRALLGAAIGAGLATIGAALGRPRAVRAADDDPVLVGGEYTAGSVTKFTNSTNSEDVLEAVTTGTGFGVIGTSNSGTGVAGTSTSATGTFGVSTSGYGVYGESASSYGVYGKSASTFGVFGHTTGSDKTALVGWAQNNGTGILGAAGGGGVPAARQNTGVHGYADVPLLTDPKGVFGESPNGHGVHGKTTSGYAGYFEGPVYTTKFWELKQVSGAATPGTSDRARVYLNVSNGHQSLRIRFGNGIVRIIAKDN